MNLVKIRVLHGGGDVTNLANYRRISIPHIISYKELQKISHSRLTKPHILCDSQYGFRKKQHGTDPVQEKITKY